MEFSGLIVVIADSPFYVVVADSSVRIFVIDVEAVFPILDEIAW